MIKAIIVDDEPLARDVLNTYADKLPTLEIVASCGNAIEAGDALKEYDLDLIFLDIQMPQITGLDFLKSLKNPPLVIFTTAHPDYAVEGFELDAVDYLMKPISLDRFMKSINKVEEKLATQLNTPSEPSEEEDYLFVKADKKLIKVNFEDVIYIEGLKDYVIIRMEYSRVITLQTMKSLETKLPDRIFKRIHRSYIINTNKIEAIVGNMVEVIEKGKAKHIPIGKNYREELLSMVNDKRL